MYKDIPSELKNQNNWCCYRLEKKGEKSTKIPVNPHTGQRGQSNNEATWSNFDTALEAVSKYDCHGLGFYFKKPYFGIDIDGVTEDIYRFCLDDHENNIVSKFIHTMESYAEISVSGTGIHIIAKGTLPPGGRRKNNVEMYDSGRFFVVTGKKIGDYDGVLEDEHGKIGYLHNEYIGSKASTVIKKQDICKSDLSVDEIIGYALNSKNKDKIKLFLEGGWEQLYDSHSEADLSFCNDLAFWCNCDIQKMDEIFRNSSLYRKKWDRVQSGSTYGEITLNRAVQDRRDVFIPEKEKFYSYDDTGNAMRLVDKFGNSLRYSYDRKNWYYYNKKHWEIDKKGTAKKFVNNVVDNMKYEKIFIPDGTDEDEAKKLFNRHVKNSRSNRWKNYMLKESEALLSIELDEFDSDLDLLNVQNGYLNLKTLSLYPHSYNRYFTKISGTNYVKDANCQLWMKFLDQIFDHNQELISYIQRAVGYSLSAHTTEQVMFVLYGDGRNGKSVFLDIIREIMGNYASAIQPQTIMTKKFETSASGDIARLAGTRLVTTTESKFGEKLNEGLVKQLTGGDMVTARRLYENEIEFIPRFKLWMATNHKPIIRGNDIGVWRRISLVPFDIQIKKDAVDMNLTSKLKKELPGVLNWALSGLVDWQKNGLQEPQIIGEGRAEYRKEMDVLECFIDECCERVFLKQTSVNELYRNYKQWAINNNEYQMSSTKFGVEMSKKFKKIKSGNIYYEGIILKNPPFFNSNPLF